MNTMQDLLMEIMGAAYAARASGQAHVFVDFSAHVNWLSVTAYPVDQSYQREHALRPLIKRTTIDLDDDDAEGMLRDILDAIHDLPVSREVAA